MASQQELNDRLYNVTRRPAVPLARKDFAAAAAQEARSLLAQGADANYSGDEKWCALNSAISSGNADIVQALLDHGAKVTARTVTLVGITVERVQEDYENASADLKDIFKQGTDAREKIAAAVFEKAVKEDFVGTNAAGKTILDLVAPSQEVTAILKASMKKHGLTVADLSPSRAKRIKAFISKKLKGPGR